MIALACDDLTHDATHDLARAGLGQVGDNVDLLGRRKGTDDLADLEDELLDKGGFVARVILEFTAMESRSAQSGRMYDKRHVPLERDKGVDGLTGELVVSTDNGGLSNTVVEDESRLDLGGRETVTGDVDNI